MNADATQRAIPSFARRERGTEFLSLCVPALQFFLWCVLGEWEEVDIEYVLYESSSSVSVSDSRCGAGSHGYI